jgi:hypothetical protein
LCLAGVGYDLDDLKQNKLTKTAKVEEENRKSNSSQSSVKRGIAETTASTQDCG